MKTKVCTKCHEEKGLAKFGNSKFTKDGKRYTCKNCQLIYTREYVKQNRERVLAYMKIYCQNHRPAFVNYARAWKHKHSELIRQRAREERKQLKDGYVKSVLCQYSSLKYANVTDEMVRIRRVIMKFKRFIKE